MLLAVQPLDQLGERFDLAAAEAGEGLVQQQQIGPGRQRAGDFEPAEVTVGQRLHLLALAAAEPDLFEQVPRTLFLVYVVVSPRRKARHEYVLEEVHADERTRQLKRSRHAAIDDLVRREAGDRLAVEPDRP